MNGNEKLTEIYLQEPPDVEVKTQVIIKWSTQFRANYGRGVFRTLSNIYDEAFWEDSRRVLPIDYFHRKAPSSMCVKVLNTSLYEYSMRG